MIELNLLPDVKQEYIKAERSRRLVISVSFISAAASVGLLLLLLSVSGLQKKNINDLTDDIKSSTKELKAKDQISKILTVQNQLVTLPELHEAKPAAAKVFEYLNQVTPANVDINNLTVDFVEKSISISGNADSLSSVNKYVDTLKFTTYTVAGSKSSQPAFSNVVMSSYALGTGSVVGTDKTASKPATYTITMNYDSAIFDIKQPVVLTVPKLTTTRSTSGSPTELFTTQPTKSSGGN